MISNFPLNDFLGRLEESIEINLATTSMPAPNWDIFKENMGDIDLGQLWLDAYPELKALISSIYGYKEDDILITTGSNEGLFLIYLALLEKGRNTIVESPTYPPLFLIPKSLNYNLNKFTRKYDERFELPFKKIKNLITPKTTLITISNPNNPTSTIIDKKDIKKLIDIAEEKNTFVLCDEVYHDFAFDDKKPTAYDLGDNTIIVGSLTKYYGLGGIRIGWVASKSNILDSIRKLRNLCTITPSSLSQHIGAIALERKQRFDKRNEKILKKNRPIIREWITDSPKIEGHLPTFGNMAFLKVKEDISIKNLSEKLADKYNTLIAPGEFFGDNNCFRLAFGSVDGNQLRDGLKCIHKVIEEM